MGMDYWLTKTQEALQRLGDLKGSRKQHLTPKKKGGSDEA
jgi:hypothetical protein